MTKDSASRMAFVQLKAEDVSFTPSTLVDMRAHRWRPDSDNL